MADRKNPSLRTSSGGVQGCPHSKDFQPVQPKTGVADNLRYLFFFQPGERGLRPLSLCSMLNSVNCLRLTLTLKVKMSYIPCFKKRTVWEAGLSLGDLEESSLPGSWPMWSRAVRAPVGDSLAATAYIIIFSPEQKIYSQVFSSLTS